MLQKEIIQKVLDFVRIHPRTVQDIASLLQNNWRTADRYVEQIAQETGQINTKIFRAGTRGALKIVYWRALEPGKGSAYQERLLQHILTGKQKEDFSPFDIYQFVEENKREIVQREKEIDYSSVLLEAKHQILFFSGNLSWVRQRKDIEAIEQLVRNKVSFKILTRIDILSQEQVRYLLQLNHRLGRDALELRHCQHPLRGIIVDDSFASMREVFSPQYYAEITQKTFLFYLIRDPEWLGWLQKVFWLLWNQSIDAETRLKALKEIRE